MGSLAARRGRARSAHTRETLAFVALTALVAIAPLLLGGAYVWGVLIIAELAALALGVALWANRGRTRMHGVVWYAFAIAFAWTVVQALPLPCGLVRMLAPDSAHALERTNELLGQAAPSVCTLSRDPANTRQEIVKGIAILCAFCAAALLVQLGERRSVLRALAAAGTLLAVISLAHALSKATRVFGIYEPVDVHDPPFIAPLLNLNTLGGLLAACWPLATAFAITTRKTHTRVLWLVAATLIVATVLMTRSRGAVGALLIALIAFGLLGLRARVRSGHPARDQRARIGIAAAIVLATLLTSYGFYAQIEHEFETGGWDKLRLIAAAWSFSLDHAWLGVGRGAFAAVFASAPLNIDRRFVYPENFVVQWAAEWGLPMTVLLLVALGVAFVAAIKRAKSWERAAAVSGCIALAAQNLVDIGSELASVAVIAAALLAAAICEREDGQRSDASTQTWRTPLAVLAGLGALSTFCLAPPLLHDELAAIETRLRASAARRARAQFRNTLAQGMHEHPSEPNLPIVAADDALRNHDRHAGRFINRALELAPNWALPHAEAALWLWNGGRRSQAVLELATAARGDIYAVRDLTCVFTLLWPDGVVRVADKTGRPALFLELAASCPRGSDQADQALLRYAPRSTAVRIRRGNRALLMHQFEQALQYARDALGIDPAAAGAAQIEVEALRSLDRTAEALVAVRRALRASPDAVRLREAELQLLIKLGDRPGLTQALTELRSAASDARELARAYQLEGDGEAALQNPNAAIRAYQQAYDVGADPDALRRIASLARGQGDLQRARRAYAQLCAINPEDSESCTAVTRLLPRAPD